MKEMLLRAIFCVLILFVYADYSSAQSGLLWWARDVDAGTRDPYMADTSVANGIVPAPRDQLTSGVVVRGQRVYSVGSDGPAMYIYCHTTEGVLVWKTKIEAYVRQLPSQPVSEQQPQSIVSANSLVVTDNHIFVGGYWELNDADTVTRMEFYNALGINGISPRSKTVINADTSGQIGYIRPRVGFSRAGSGLRFVGFTARYNLDGDYGTMVPFGALSAVSGESTIFSIGSLKPDGVGGFYIGGEYGQEACVCTNPNSANHCLGSATYRYQGATVNATDTMSSSAYLVRYDAALNVIWAKDLEFETTTSSRRSAGRINAMTSTSDFVYAGGRYVGRIKRVVDKGQGGSTSTNSIAYSALLGSAVSGASSDAFLAKIGRNGNVQWIRKLGTDGTASESCIDIAVWDNRIYTIISGDSANVANDFTYYVNSVSIPRVVSNQSVLLLAAYTDPGGTELSKVEELNLSWVHQMTGSYGSIFASAGASLQSSSSNGDVYMAAMYSEDANVTTTRISNSSTTPATRTLNKSGSIDAYILQASSIGIVQTDQTIKGSGSASIIVSGLGIDAQGFYISGNFQVSVDFEPSPTISEVYTSRFGRDAYIAKYGCFQPTLSLAPGSSTCEGQPITIQASTNCPTGRCNFSYLWTDPSTGQQITSSNNVNVFNGVLGTNVRRLNLIDNNTGCVATDSIEITVDPDLQLTTSGSVLVCENTAVTFNTSTTPSGATVEWFANNNLSTPVFTGSTFTTTTPGSYFIRATRNTCQATGSVVYNQYSSTSPRILPDTPAICGGGGALIRVVDCPGCSYSWTVPSGSQSLSSGDNITADISGVYQVNISDANGCLYSEVIDVINRPFLNPVIDARNVDDDPVTTICNGEPLILETLPCGSCTYSWSDGTTGPYTFAFAQQTFQVTVTNLITGCVGVSAPTEIRSSVLNQPQTTVSLPSICENVATSITTPAVLNVLNPCVSCIYTWIDNTNPAVILPNVSAPLNYNLSVSDAGDYFVRVQDSLGCTQESALTYVPPVVPVTPPDLRTSSHRICSGNSPLLSTDSCASCSYRWFRTGAEIVNADQPSYSTTQTGDYQVEVRYPNGCRVLSDTVQIRNLSTSFTPTIVQSNAFICDTSAVVLSMTGTFQRPPNWSYQWYKDGQPIMNQVGYELIVNQPGQYLVEVTNALGCEGSSNLITLQRSTNGANPLASSDRPSICTGETANLTVIPAPGVGYTWFNASGLQLFSGTNSYSATATGGYYAELTDVASGCIYQSNLVQITETQLPAPTLSSSELIPCNPNSVILSTPPCAGCSYEWERNTGSGGVLDTLLTTQNTISTDTSGDYRVRVIQAGGICVTPFSNYVALSFASVNAQIVSPAVPNVCNGQPVNLEALPDLGPTTCPDCEYYWYRNGVQTATAVTTTVFPANQSGDYQVVIRNSAGCLDTSAIESIGAINIDAVISSSTQGICGTGTPLILSADTCSGCSYGWFSRDNTVVGSSFTPLTNIDTSTVFLVNGPGAQGEYLLIVSRGGCQSRDSMIINVAPAFVDSILANPSHLTSCNGSTVLLSSANGYTGCSYQWYLNGTAITGANSQSYLTDVPGDYYVETTDINLCIATTSPVLVQAFNQPSNFALDFSSLGSIPLSYPVFALDSFLLPASLHGTGFYSSLTANSGIDSLARTFEAGASGVGPGIHPITYTYTQGACTFSVTDTLFILDAMSLDVLNELTPSAPQYEACVNDQVRLQLVNFTFNPDTIIFNAGGGNTIRLPINNSGLTQSSGVWSGSILLTVPPGARTGKINLSDGISNYESQFFMVVNSPASSISLAGVSSPLCSNQGLIDLVGTPATATGNFRAAYLSDTTDLSPTATLLTAGGELDLSQVMGYDLTGLQQLQLSYLYYPTYTNGLVCPNDSILSLLNVDVRDVRLDSIEYTPLSITQASEQMSNLTRLIYPVQSRLYSGAYSGVYVANNQILPSTLDTISSGANPDPFNQAVNYTVQNGGCSQTIEDTVRLWRAPQIFDFLPADICQSPDTIYFGRDAAGLYLEIRDLSGVYNTFRADTLYARNENSRATADFFYNEEINNMTLSPLGPGTGVEQLVIIPGQERFAIIPSQVPSTSLTLNLAFDYYRELDYFNPIPSSQTTQYRIAEVSKTVTFEQPFSAEISPATVANPIFCPVNQNIQLSGIPAGGDFRIAPSGSTGFLTLPNDILNPGMRPSGLYDLRYVVISNACADSSLLTIRIPDNFSVTDVIGLANATGEYCERDMPDTIQGIINPATTQLDSSSIVFTVGGLQAGLFFNPASAGNPNTLATDTVNVGFAVSDIYGCRQSYTRQFLVHSTPRLELEVDNTTYTPATASATTPEYCFNAPLIPVSLQALSSNTTTEFFTAFSQGGALVNAITASPTNPSNLGYSAPAAGVGLDTIVYAYVDGNSCTDTIRQTIRTLALPQLQILTSGGDTLLPSYCEGDIVPLFGSPSNSTSLFGSVSTTNTADGSNLDSAAMGAGPNTFIPLITPSLPITTQEEIFYRYQDLNTGCADTVTRTIEVRNRADVAITGLPATFCADRVDMPITVTVTGANVTSSDFSLNASRLNGVAIPNADQFSLRQTAILTANFRPDSLNARNFPANVNLRYDYVSNNCPHFQTYNFRVNPLPHLFLNNPGDAIRNSTDTRPHICISRDSAILTVFDSSALTSLPHLATNYLGWTANPAINSSLNRGVVFNLNNNTFYYLAEEMARRVSTFGGSIADTIVYRYEDANGCVDTLSELLVLDTIPELGFAGIDPAFFDSTLNRYVFCQNDSPVLIVPSPFGGDLSFNTQFINDGVFTFNPPSLPMPPTGYRQDSLNYVFTTRRYVSQPNCADSIKLFIETRPIPVLQFSSVPTEYCVRDSQERIVLRATPVGGSFVDATQPLVLGGIVSDSLFNPVAQAGRRTVSYAYTDAGTGCSNLISQVISVYRSPRPSFQTEGGCEGRLMSFRPDSTGLSNIAPSIDSLTMAVWDYGDGQVDTLFNITDPTILPLQQHAYAQTGIYFPQLTLVNRGQCDTSFIRRIVISPVEMPLPNSPYEQDFEADAGNWFQEELALDTSATDTLWQWGIATGRRINTVGSGSHVWATRLSEAYTPDRAGWVYSPCFDLSALDRPMVKFDIFRDARTAVDGAVVEYYDEALGFWKVLGAPERGVNWYGRPYIISRPGAQASSAMPPVGWTGSNPDWQDARYRLDVSGVDLRNTTNVRFRLAFASSNNTIVNGLEGFAFDNVYVGNRRRNVLVEHFTNQSIGGMAAVENGLYNAIYNTTYGRDVHLLQFHIPNGGSDEDYDRAQPEGNTRSLVNGVNQANRMRLNGGVVPDITTTADFVNNRLDALDTEMLQDPTFAIRLLPLSIRGSELTLAGELEALDSLPLSDYVLHVVISEDTVLSRQRHFMMNVVRKMLPGADGQSLPQAWVPGDIVPISQVYTIPNLANPARLQATVFIQDVNDSMKIHQVASTRDISLYNGPVSVEEIAEIPGAEVLDMKLFPNPAQDYFFVEFDQALQGNYNWRLFDLQGRVLRQGQAQEGSQQIQVETSSLSGALYIFAIEHNGFYSQRKVIIRR